MTETAPPPTSQAPRPSFGRRLLLVAASLVLGAAIAEGLLRLALGNPYREESTDWVLPLAMHHAGKDLPVQRGAIFPDSPIGSARTDERGYLLPSRRFDDPDATIAFLGGSTTECLALDEADRFPARVSTLLEARGVRVNVLNAGKSGNTTHDAVNLLLNHVVQDGPNVVVLMEAANDFGVLARDPTYATRSSETVTARLPLRFLLQKLSSRSAIVGALRAWGTSRPPTPGEIQAPSRSRGESVAPTAFEQRLRSFVGICRAFGIQPVLMTQPFAVVRTELTPDWLELRDQIRFNETIREVAASEGVPLIDLVQHLEDDVPGWDQPRKIFYDGIHVTAEGARVYAEHITARLQESIPTLRSVGSPPPPGPSVRSR